MDLPAEHIDKSAPIHGVGPRVNFATFVELVNNRTALSIGPAKNNMTPTPLSPETALIQRQRPADGGIESDTMNKPETTISTEPHTAPVPKPQLTSNQESHS